MIDIDSFEHFSFDLWMTIIRSNPQFKPKRTVLLKDYFEIDKSLEEINTVIRHYDNLFNTISEKTGNHIEREEIFFLILETLGQNILPITNEDMKGFFVQADELFLENMPEIIWTDIDKMLSVIKENEKTASILSNTAFIHGDSLRKVLEHHGLAQYFSFMIFSDEVKVSKPNLQMYELMFKNITDIRQLEKKQIIHIGDNKTADYDGAKTFGVNSKLVKF